MDRGNANEDGTDYPGWLVGHFVDEVPYRRHDPPIPSRRLVRSRTWVTTMDGDRVDVTALEADCSGHGL